jgi:hypothetical protein
MAKQTFTTGQVLTAAQMTSLQQTAMGGGSTTAKTASYTLVAADAGTVVQMNSASATTITVNTALFAAGDTVQIQNIGAGVCTVTAGTATVSTAGSLALVQYDGGTLYFTSTSASIFFEFIQSGSASSGPAFSARSAAEQLVTAGTATKVLFGTEDFDTASNFASSRFTPTTAGYYQINSSIILSSNSAGDFLGFFYKNGSVYNRFSCATTALINFGAAGGMVVAMNGSTDYVEVYATIGNSGNPRIDNGSGQTQFSGVWIRGL